MATQVFDAVVVGASLAGCTTAALLARNGASVALVERHVQPDAHKQLCTHFLQASALPVLQRLGLDRMIEDAGGLRNPIEVHTPYGWIGFYLDSNQEGLPTHGYNIRRLRLDPMLRNLAAATPGVAMLPGHTAVSLIEEAGRIAGVEVQQRGADATALRARLVVAADGRNSGLARLAGVEPKEAPNSRFGISAAMRNVDLQRGNRSQMWLTGDDAAYVFPNDDGVTVVVWMGQKEQLDAWRDDPLEGLKQRFGSLPDAPTLQSARLAGDVLTVKDYPNLWRPARVREMALVGDAMMSVDPLWGVGCGWAFQTAAWLCDSVSAALAPGADPADLADGLRCYERECSALTGHRFLINDFARRRAFNPIERLMFAAAAKDRDMALHVNRFGARIDGPAVFLSPPALLKALWINLRQPVAPADGTRPIAATETSGAASTQEG